MNGGWGIDRRPLGLLAELTHRCPLGCPYCSNPTSYGPVEEELCGDEWRRVFEEAGELGVLHALLSGGEPLLRADLADLVAAARRAGLYTNLITSGLGLTPQRAEELRGAGLDSVQISLQSDEADVADWVAGVPAHAAKLKAARLVRELGLPLTINVVIHRYNIDHTASIIHLAESLGAHRLELANVQFYGWAFRNRNGLLPSVAQIERAESIAAEAGARLQGRMTILYVRPDYYGDRPKACMGGWGRRLPNRRSGRRRAPMPDGEGDPGPAVRQRPASVARLDLGRFGRIQPLPRDGLDARALPQLRPSRGRLRRLPLPGRVAHRGCGRHRPGMWALAPPRVAPSSPRRRVARYVPLSDQSGRAGPVSFRQSRSE